MPETRVATFGAIRGHARVCEFLRTAVITARLPHALLFTGPEGVGKYCVARALVAWMQCEQRADDACGVCRACRQVAAGTHPDVQLVTVAAGKKEIGVDRIREVKRFMQLRPVQAGAKLVILDEAHRLTVAAQNALLKTLEEPPAHSFLILVVHNADVLLPTVRSRCQRVQFSPLALADVLDVLVHRCDVDAALAAQLSTIAEGSPGHALALHDCLAGAPREQLEKQLAGLDQARYVRAMQLANELSQPEAQALPKLELLLSHFRDEALRAVGAGALASADANGPPAAAVDAVRTALRQADAVHAAWMAMRRSTPNRQLLMEALVMRLADA